MTDRIQGVATAVAAFIGRTGSAAGPAPRPIASVADYRSAFGAPAAGTDFGLAEAVELFYENGGGDAWVAPVEGDGLASWLEALARVGDLRGPTLLLAPDALGLPRDDYYALARAMIGQAAGLGDRFAIVDVHGGFYRGDPFAPQALAPLDDFRAGIAPLAEGRSYGAAYFPWLVPAGDPAAIVPPSAVLAGIYAAMDAQQGVWTAPTNVFPAGIAGVSVFLSENGLERVGLSAADGLSVNPIRFVTGRGAAVWGAHTLDGDSEDFRYIAVRRTLIYIEQSVKEALTALAPLVNAPPAWTRARTTIEDFLAGLWRAGALQGASADDAFMVDCGPVSPAAEDLTSGVMNVQIQVALSHPAEFVPIELQQQLQPPPD